MLFTPAINKIHKPDGKSLLFLYHGQSILLVQGSDFRPESCLPVTIDCPGDEYIYFGELDDFSCYCRLMPDIPRDLVPVKTRELIPVLPDSSLFPVLKGQVLSYWGASTRFCGFCGHTTERDSVEWAYFCPSCQNRFYPRIAPAIIVRITDGPRILLARNKSHSGRMFSNVAGFVDPGESLEETVRREVCEEVGVAVSDIRYFGSQSWSMTQSLIVAFTAVYAGGTIKPDGFEIVEACWFTPENMPELPGAGSISRKMINDFTQNGLT